MILLGNKVAELESSTTAPPPRPPSTTDPWAQFAQRGSSIPSPTPQPAHVGGSAAQPGGPNGAIHRDNDDTDWNHLILGGWPKDSKRFPVHEEAQKFVATWEGVKCEKVGCYGQRCEVAHVYLAALCLQDAKARYFDIKSKYAGTFTSSLPGSSPAWISPSRTPARRERNRFTKQVLVGQARLHHQTCERPGPRTRLEQTALLATW